MRNTRQGTWGRNDPGLGRTLLGSLGIHLLIILLFAGSLLPRFEEDRRPVYYVDLANLPVKAPQAGRPDAAPAKSTPQVKPAPAPVKPSPPPAKPKPVKASPPAVKATPPTPKPSPVAKTVERYEDQTLSAIDRMRRDRERSELKEKLAALAADDRRGQGPEEAPVGMADGHGTEAGPSYEAWAQAAYKQAWTLSRYQVSRVDLEASVLVTFDGEGHLKDYRFLTKSGDPRFDDSVKSAILLVKELPNPPGGRLELPVVFNLKDLLKD